MKLIERMYTCDTCGYKKPLVADPDGPLTMERAERDYLQHEHKEFTVEEIVHEGLNKERSHKKVTVRK